MATSTLERIVLPDMFSFETCLPEKRNWQWKPCLITTCACHRCSANGLWYQSLKVQCFSNWNIAGIMHCCIMTWSYGFPNVPFLFSRNHLNVNLRYILHQCFSKFLKGINGFCYCVWLILLLLLSAFHSSW